MNFGFIIDNRKCIGCHACTVACKAEHDVPLGVNRTWVKYVEKGTYPHTRRLFSVMRCNHCEDAPCVEICPVEALYIRDDGIVDFNKNRCIACKSCTQACPYDAIYIDPESVTAAKCNYCAHRVDIGLEPACVNVCPEHAIISGDMDDPNSEIAQLLAREQVQMRKAEKGTKPNLYYIDGDLSSLNPTAATSSGDYVMTKQAAGVGHYARYAEQRVKLADQEAMLQKLNDTGVTNGTPEAYGVNVPPGGDSSEKMVSKAWQVVTEMARRVHDVPSKGVMWGWEVSGYVWTKAIASGVILVAFMALLFNLAPVTVATQWIAALTGLIFLAATGILLIKDLDQPTRFSYVMLRSQWRSWLVRGGYIINAFGAAVTLWIIGKLIAVPIIVQIGAWLSLISAVGLAIYTAFLFAQAKGRDFWQSPVLPLHMLVHAFMAGAAFLALAMMVTGTTAAWAEYLRITLIVSVIANLLILGAELMTTHATTDTKLVVKMILGGRFKGTFWFGSYFVGNVLPLVILLTIPGLSMIALSGILILVGIYATEHVWVRAPQLVPLS